MKKERNPHNAINTLEAIQTVWLIITSIVFVLFILANLFFSEKSGVMEISGISLAIIALGWAIISIPILIIGNSKIVPNDHYENRINKLHNAQCWCSACFFVVIALLILLAIVFRNSLLVKYIFPVSLLFMILVHGILSILTDVTNNRRNNNRR
jgi:hypothetical protein